MKVPYSMYMITSKPSKTCFLMSLSLSGLVSYTEYLFLLTILTSKYSTVFLIDHVEFSRLTRQGVGSLVFISLSWKMLLVPCVLYLQDDSVGWDYHLPCTQAPHNFVSLIEGLLNWRVRRSLHLGILKIPHVTFCKIPGQ